jgi:hypothetical protein
MPVSYDGSTISFRGECMVEEALPLVEFLRTNAGARIDMSECGYVHASLLQALAAAQPKDLTLPTSPNLSRWVAAVLGATCTVSA